MQTESIFIATVGMLHIFLSFFMAYAIYKTIIVWASGVALGWFPFLLWLGLFVIAGIGADDVFVVVDAWKQSKALLPKETPLPNRISWVHHRAATAMFITSFTTAAAFLSNCVNFVIPVGLFGFFMALLVLLNYLMVISMFPAGIVIYHHWLEERTWKSGLRWKKGPGGAGGGWSPLSNITPASLAAVADLADGFDDDCAGLTGAKMRPVERFFESVFAPHLYKARKGVVGVCSAFALIVFIFYALQMEKETEPVALWPKDYVFEVYKVADDEAWPDHYDTTFGCEPHCEDIFMVFGALARDDGNALNPKDHGQLHLDEAFSLSHEGVEWLAGLMQELRELPEFKDRADENALRSPLAAMAAGSPPVSVVEMAGFPKMEGGGGCSCAEDFEVCFDSYVRQARGQGLGELFDRTVNFDRDTGKLRTVVITLHSTITGGDEGTWNYPVRKRQWDSIAAVFDKHAKTAPAGWGEGFFFSWGFIGLDMEESLVFSCVESGSIAIVLAFCTLLCFTKDLLMSLIASISILVTLILVIGWLVAIGWSLGVLESMCIAISVGICVDFICHHAHAYDHAKGTGGNDPTREERITHSLVEMGITVVSAAATTGTAAVILLVFTTVTFFTEFGVFLAICMACSITVALVYFHALLAIVGPLGPKRSLAEQCRALVDRARGGGGAGAEAVTSLNAAAQPW